jgi:hypothetical protein
MASEILSWQWDPLQQRSFLLEKETEALLEPAHDTEKLAKRYGKTYRTLTPEQILRMKNSHRTTAAKKGRSLISLCGEENCSPDRLLQG